MRELILFVGYPCLGKSSFYRRHFQPIGYKHVNQDTLKTRDKCIKAVEQALGTGESCVVGEFCLIFSGFPFIVPLCNADNTNRDVKTRKYYVDVARRLGVPVRYVILNVTSLSRRLYFADVSNFLAMPT
jgi:bifunctional polynucleotide phosphatase/kinase